MKKILILIFCFYTAIGVAQVKDTATKAIKANSNEFNPDAVELSNTSLDSLENASDPLAKKRLILQEKYDKAANDYYVWTNTYKRNIFQFQYVSGIIIFIVVLFIVFTGLAFSAWQFYITMHHVRIKQALILQNKDAGTDNPVDGLKSDIEISTSGVKVNSSVLGVIIIALSLAFFYLYLAYVYPINPVSTAKKPETAVEAKK